jgi:hypothetical protein
VTTVPDDDQTSADRSTEEAVASGMQAGDNAAVLRALATSIALLPQVPPAEGEERPEDAIALPVLSRAPAGPAGGAAGDGASPERPLGGLRARPRPRRRRG